MKQNGALMQQNDAPKGECNVLLQEPSPRVNGRKKYQRGPVKQAEDLTIKAMLLQGTPQRKIAAALGISVGSVYHVVRKMKAQQPDVEDLKSGLMSPRLGEMSVAVVEHFLKKGAKLKTVKGSDAMAAVKAVADRRWPTRQEQAPATFSFANINLNMFLPDPQPAALDATPTPTCSVEEGGKNE